MRQTIVARAPTRLDFVGGWTDVRPFCEHEPGLVVNAAFGVSARVKVCFTEHPKPITDPFVRAACKRFALEKISIDLSSDAPIGSGLGGSGAVGVVLVGALAAMTDKSMTRREIADLAHDIEVQDLGIIGGKQDQYAASLGGFLALTFLGDEVRVQPLALTPERVATLEAQSVVVYTGQSRVSGSIHANVQEAYRSGNRETLDALERIRAVAREFYRTLPDGELAMLGELLNANWEAQKRLHPSTTNERVNTFFRVAKDAGALGGKALGAGGGGCLFFLAREGEKKRLADVLTASGGQVLEAGFNLEGLTVERGG